MEQKMPYQGFQFSIAWVCNLGTDTLCGNSDICNVLEGLGKGFQIKVKLLYNIIF